jgi:hypothetical protein
MCSDVTVLADPSPSVHNADAAYDIGRSDTLIRRYALMRGRADNVTYNETWC